MEKLSTRLWTIAMLMIAMLTVASCSSEDEEIPTAGTTIVIKINQARKEGYLIKNNALINGKKKAVANVEKLQIEDAPEEIISEWAKKNLFKIDSKEIAGTYIRVYLEKEFNDRNYLDIIYCENGYGLDRDDDGLIREIEWDSSKDDYWTVHHYWFGYTDKDAGIDKWWPTNIKEAVYSCVWKSGIHIVVPYVSDGKNCILTLDCDISIPWK